jgi:hypothetical protein
MGNLDTRSIVAIGEPSPNGLGVSLRAERPWFRACTVIRKSPNTKMNCFKRSALAHLGTTRWCLGLLWHLGLALAPERVADPR